MLNHALATRFPLPATELGAVDRRQPSTNDTSWLQSRLDQIAVFLLKFRAIILISLHVSVFSVVFCLAYLIRFDGAVPAREWRIAVSFLPMLLVVKLSAFLVTGSYRGWCRYNSFADMLLMARAATFGSLGAAAVAYLSGTWSAVPRSVLLIDWAGTILAMESLRGGIRLFRERYYPRMARVPLRPVLVVGASETGLPLVREIHAQPQLGMRVVGFLDENAQLRGRVLSGIPVLGQLAAVHRLSKRLGTQTVLVYAPAVLPQVVRTLVETCAGTGITVQVVPGFNSLLSGHYELQPRAVDLDDLLCRAPVRLDDHAVSQELSDRVVLVTGAAGSIGSELCRQILAFGPRRLVLLDHSENGLFYVERELRERAGETEIVAAVASITDGRRLRTLFQEHGPEVIYHAAAHKHVPMMEANPGEAVKNNVFGTRTLVDEAVRAHVRAFVMISTDKAVRPTSVMGACKRAAEMYVQALTGKTRTRLVTVRFGNVLGSNGSVVPLFREQIRRGGPVTVTHPDMTRYFMTIPEATQLVLQAGALGKGGEIFVLDMGAPVRVLDMARDLIRLSGMVEGRDIQITFTGLRPGEKLYEELYDDDETQLPTPHPKVFSAQHRPFPLAEIERAFDQLAAAVERQPKQVVAALKEVVPEYRPSGINGRPDAALKAQPPANDAGEPAGDAPRSLAIGAPNGAADPVTRLVSIPSARPLVPSTTPNSPEPKSRRNAGIM